MNPGPGLRRALVAAAVVAVAVLGTLAWASHVAKARILQALGPRATVGAIELGWPGVTLRDVHIAADAAPGAWPAPDEFRAALVAVRVDVTSLWGYRHGEPLRIADVRVEDGTLVMLRTAGHVTMLPALRETTSAKAAALAASGAASKVAAVDPLSAGPTPPATALVVEHAHVEGLAVDLYDATLGPGAPRRLQFTQVRGDVGGIALPTLDTSIDVDASGVVKGVERDGTASVRGAFTPATHDAQVALRLAGVDLIALQPWLLRLGEGSVRHGSLDLRLDAKVVRRQLDAPGHLALAGLELADEGGTFAQAKRRAVLAALRRDGRVDIDFRLQGRTDDPKFSLDDSLVGRIAGGLAQSTSDSVKSAVEGVGGAIKGLFGGSR